MIEKSQNNAVAAIRVSSTKQGTEGDSPEAQKEQLERFAQSKDINIKKFFVFMESASKEQQPMQEAVDYCKNPKNKIDLFIIRSIDRFTRGGSLSYDLLKTQLDKAGVQLVDIYGIISSNKVNTLEHLGFEYRWSVYSPTKKSEILEAERSKDELRDIMSRLVGAEIRYTKLGYWMRKPPYGYTNEKVETTHGKRVILKPHPEEAYFIRTMFRLRAEGKHTDRAIVSEINEMGYRSGKGAQLNEHHLWRLLRNAIYAGVNNEKWTGDQPVRCAFEGLISIELFNHANKGRIFIVEHDDSRVTIETRKEKRYQTEKGSRNAEFPFRKYITCPKCNRLLLGSASRGRSGKYYPAYHCTKGNHNFRISKQKLEERVDQFVADLKFSPKYLEQVFETVRSSWEQMQAQQEVSLQQIEKQIIKLETELMQTIQKIKLLTNQTAIKYMEDDLARLEQEIDDLKQRHQDLTEQKSLNLKRVKAKLKHLVKHLGPHFKDEVHPLKKARLFGMLFDKKPTYEDLEGGTDKDALLQMLNPMFAFVSPKTYQMVTPRGIEPLFPG